MQWGSAHCSPSPYIPLLTANVFCQFWNLVQLVATPSTAPALFGGGLLGYVMYDCTHYYLHHGQPSSGVPKYLKVRRYLKGQMIT